MDNKKFEQLIDLIINEDEEQARALFHDIVVEKSREIYESMMDEEMDMDESGMHGQVGDLMDEISAEEEGMTEDDEDLDMGDDDGDEIADLDMDDDEEGEEDLEDRVVDLEDKLDQLMADEENEPEHHDGIDDPDFGGEEGDEEAMMESDDEEEDEMDEEVMEAITLKKVSVTHGDNGSNAKSIALHEPKIKTQGVAPVKFSGQAESVPTSPKGPSNAYSKGETEVKHAKQWKNAPAQAGQDLEKAPAPTKSQASGTNTKSPVNESRKFVKKAVK
jgi:hypothetical protein